MNSYSTIEELAMLTERMKALESKIIQPKSKDDEWKQQLMGQFYPTQSSPREDIEETRKVGRENFEFIQRAKSMPKMDLTPGEKNWIEKAKQIMKDSEGEKARQLAREREALNKALAEQVAQAAKMKEAEEKAAAEERRRKQIEDEVQRTEWDIL